MYIAIEYSCNKVPPKILGVSDTEDGIKSLISGLEVFTVYHDPDDPENFSVPYEVSEIELEHFCSYSKNGGGCHGITISIFKSYQNTINLSDLLDKVVLG